MEAKRKEDTGKVRFSSLNPGDVFFDGYSRRVCIKLDRGNYQDLNFEECMTYVDAETGILYGCDEDYLVTLANFELVEV